VASVTVADGHEVNIARPGENVGVRLEGARPIPVSVGSVLCCAHGPSCLVASSFLADLHILELPDDVPLVTAGFKCVLHLHMAVAECTLDQLLIHDTGKAKIKHPPFVKSFAQVLVKIDVAAPVALDTADHMPALGHLTLRATSAGGRPCTLAFGRIVRVLVPKKKSAP
jgi:peptide chain release factor subunit 3